MYESLELLGAKHLDEVHSHLFESGGALAVNLSGTHLAFEDLFHLDLDTLEVRLLPDARMI